MVFTMCHVCLSGELLWLDDLLHAHPQFGNVEELFRLLNNSIAEPGFAPGTLGQHASHRATPLSKKIKETLPNACPGLMQIRKPLGSSSRLGPHSSICACSADVSL